MENAGKPEPASLYLSVDSAQELLLRFEAHCLICEQSWQWDQKQTPSQTLCPAPLTAPVDVVKEGYCWDTDGMQTTL